MAIGDLHLVRASARKFFRLSEAAGDGNRKFRFSARKRERKFRFIEAAGDGNRKYRFSARKRERKSRFSEAAGHDNLDSVRPQGMAIGDLDFSARMRERKFRLSEAAGDGNGKFRFSPQWPERQF